MPELPEVETVARTLAPRLVGKRVLAVETSGLALRRPIDRKALERATVGAEVIEVRRVAKYILVLLSTGQTLLVHLGMSGRLLFADASRVRVPHTHVVFTLSGGGELRYVDPRRFGVMLAYPTADAADAAELRVLGVDPLSGGFTEENLFAELKASRRDLKAFLLDQGNVAGLGNIYVCEALFHARLSPRRRAYRVTQKECAALKVAIVSVLESAIARRGTSFSDYVDGDGVAGDNQPHLAVYARERGSCVRCQGKIRRIVQGARSTFYCPKCQK